MPQIRSSFVVRIVLEIENQRTSLLSLLIIFICGLSSFRTRRAMPPDLYLEICFLFFVKSSYPLIETKSISSSFVSCMPMKSYVDKKSIKSGQFSLDFSPHVFSDKIFKRSLY